ncbi:hypothetical protein [Streptomyces sp. NPDC059816]|uniref:hypothetical protein n=1 Tax=Streptomyces sp. NPDC059816 TaxID=3346960 RepID=UPI0036538DAE
MAAPMPDVAMKELIEQGKAHALADFTGAPVHYADRWWRSEEGQWYALDVAGSNLVDAQAERWRAAHTIDLPTLHSEPNPMPNAAPHQAVGES